VSSFTAHKHIIGQSVAESRLYVKSCGQYETIKRETKNQEY